METITIMNSAVELNVPPLCAVIIIKGMASILHVCDLFSGEPSWNFSGGQSILSLSTACDSAVISSGVKYNKTQSYL